MKFNRFLVCLIALGLTTSCSNSIESGGSSGGDEILKSVECVTVLGLNAALEVHYQSGRIEIVTTEGSVDITSGVPVRWCSSERSGTKSDSSSIQAPSFRYENSDSTSNSVANQNPPTTYQPIYSIDLYCGSHGALFYLLQDGSSNTRCQYSLADGSGGETEPVMSGRRGTPLATWDTYAAGSGGERICFGLFKDGQVVVASRTIPNGELMSTTCEQIFSKNSPPAPFAKSLTCPISGRITDLELPDGTETDRCVVTYADESSKVQRVNLKYVPEQPLVDFVFFHDTSWGNRFCIGLNRIGQLRSYQVGDYESTCQ